MMSSLVGDNFWLAKGPNKGGLKFALIRVKPRCVWALFDSRTSIIVIDAADFGFSGFVR